MTCTLQAWTVCCLSGATRWIHIGWTSSAVSGIHPELPACLLFLRVVSGPAATCLASIHLCRWLASRLPGKGRSWRDWVSYAGVTTVLCMSDPLVNGLMPDDGWGYPTVRFTRRSSLGVGMLLFLSGWGLTILLFLFGWGAHNAVPVRVGGSQCRCSG